MKRQHFAVCSDSMDLILGHLMVSKSIKQSLSLLIDVVCRLLTTPKRPTRPCNIVWPSFIIIYVVLVYTLSFD